MTFLRKLFLMEFSSGKIIAIRRVIIVRSYGKSAVVETERKLGEITHFLTSFFLKLGKIKANHLILAIFILVNEGSCHSLLKARSMNL